MKKLTAAGLGEVLFDVVDDSYHLGGAPANFAWHCAELGLDAYAVAAVGDDALGARAISKLGSLGDYINVAAASGQDGSFATGCVRADIDDKGIASYSFDEDCAFDHLILNDRQLELAGSCDLVCFGTLCQRHCVSRASIYSFLAHAEQALKIFDVNLRGDFFSSEIIKCSLDYCNILKLSSDELTAVCSLLDIAILQDPSSQARALYESLRQKYKILGLILTRGADGSEVFFKDEHSCMRPPKVDLADTIGAGDSFDAAFGAAIISGADLDDAHALANEVSAFVCSKYGAQICLNPCFQDRLQAISRMRK